MRLTAFAAGEKIKFREDSSNAEVKYTRNRIRIRVLPEIEKVNTYSVAAIAETMNHLNSSAKLVDIYIERLHSDIFRPAGDGYEADVSDLRSLIPAAPHIFELFRRYGLSSQQTEEMIALFDSSPGQVYLNVHPPFAP